MTPSGMKSCSTAPPGISPPPHFLRYKENQFLYHFIYNFLSSTTAESVQVNGFLISTLLPISAPPLSRNYRIVLRCLFEECVKYRKSYEPARAFRDLWARVMF